MSKELYARVGVTGLTINASVRNPTNGQHWYTVTPAFEAFNAAHIANGYAIAMTEEGTTGDYVADFPTAIVAAGPYEVDARKQVGGSPAWPTDPVVASGIIEWSGAALCVPVAADSLGAAPVAFGTALPANPTAGTTGSALFYADAKIGRRGTAQAGSASTITLDAGASATDNAYKDHFLKITSGTGSGQFATIVSYVGSTKVATISRPVSGGAWSTNPDSTSVFLIEPFPVMDLITAPPTAAAIVTAIFQDTNASDFTVLNSPGRLLMGQLEGAFVNSSSSVFTSAALANTPASGSDPWATALPGSYSPGSAGAILGQQGVDETFIGALYPGATVSAASSSTVFTLSFAAGQTAAKLVGRTVDFGVQLASPSTGVIASTVQTDSTHIAVTLAVGVSATPTVGFAASIVPTPSLRLDGTGQVYLAAAGADGITVETGVNLRQALSPILAACAGVLSGAGTGTITVKGGNVATTRVVATTDVSGNRTAVTLTLPS